MVNITKKLAKDLAKEFKLNLEIVPFEEWIDGLKIELEHGKKVSKLTNITKDDMHMTAKIALAHLIEDPRYYKYLVQMESKREKYWEKKKKPSIFLE
jgi:hypothetical protein